MKDTKLLEELGDTKLKWPKGLRKYIYKKTMYKTTNKCTTYYVNTLEIWRKRLLMRTFAFCVPKGVDRPFNMGIQEVCRRLEGEKEVLLCQIENRSMGGRTVYFTETGKWITRKERSSYYAWYTGGKSNWWFFDYDMFDYKEWMKKLEIPYCGYDSPNYEYKMPFFQYVELYKKYPKIELLAKGGMWKLITGARYLNLKGKSFEQIFKIPASWKKHIKELEISDILIIRKNDIHTMNELIYLKKASMSNLKYIKKYFNNKTLKYVDKYLLDHSVSISDFPFNEYNDYLRMAEETGCQMERNIVLFPKDLHEAHDDIHCKYREFKDKEVNKGIEKTAKNLMKYKFNLDGLFIVPAMNNKELIDESRVLDHCVRTYASRVSKGETGIMFIRKEAEPKKPFVTLELKGKKVIQVRGYRNNISIPLDQSVIDFVHKWEQEFRLEGF